MRCLLLLTLLVTAGCGSSTPPTVPPAAQGPPWFDDVTERVGVRFTHDPGPVGDYRMPQIVGSGLAVFDADGDGRPDLYFLNNVAATSSSKNVFYRQQPDGTFVDASAGSGLDFAGPCMGTGVGDVDNDGRPDLVVTLVGSVRLFLNQGQGKFLDVTTESGLSNPRWGTSATFLDFDRDGRLDLFITNYVDYDPSVPCADRHGGTDFCAPKAFPGTVSRLYRNRDPGPGKRVQFEDVTVSSGIGTLPGPGLGVYAADLTGDGWPDIFVANDGAANRLWVNQRDGTFVDEAVSRGVALTFMGQAFAGMGIAAGDINNDGMIDLYVTHLATETNTLWQQGPRGIFRDRTTDQGLLTTTFRGTGFGATLGDFDQDGSLDLAIVNGRVYRADPVNAPGLPPFWTVYAQKNQLLANNGSGTFRDVSDSNPAFCGIPNVGRGLAAVDLDGDGALDLVSTAIAGPAKIYRNVASSRGHWLQVQAIDPRVRRDAIGAEVVVRTGDKRRLRIVTPTDSFISTTIPITHFGLGSSTTIDEITVTWPDGLQERFPGGAVDQRRVVKRGEGAKP